MSSKDNVDKRRLKSEPRLNVQLDEIQKQVVRNYYEKDVNFVLGEAGTGKTLLACYIAISSFRKKEINNIIITRPAMRDNMGFLPGDIKDKMAPWVAPVVHNLEMCQGHQLTKQMMDDNQIQILPIDHTKGITYVKSCVIVDEAQDLNQEDFRMVLTRFGKDSKLIFCASETQIHKSMKSQSCIDKIIKLEKSGLVGYVTLENNHRNDVIPKILDYLQI